eukprot:352986-Chlamydomonas_euryale.AAC.9
MPAKGGVWKEQDWEFEGGWKEQDWEFEGGVDRAELGVKGGDWKLLFAGVCKLQASQRLAVISVWHVQPQLGSHAGMTHILNMQMHASMHAW